jgi:hypothetical protein
MRISILLISLIFSSNVFAESLADLRGQVFRKSATCNIIKAKEILQLSTVPFTEKEVPEIRTLIQGAKEVRTACYEQTEEILTNLLTDEQNMVLQEGSPFLLKLQYEADKSFKELLKLRKQVSSTLLSQVLSDIERHFEHPVEMAQFYKESQETQYFMQLETTLALESERRQVFVEEQRFNLSKQQKVKTLLQKAHYQFAKTLLLFEDWPLGLDKTAFFKNFNTELRYSVSILSQVLPLKDAMTEEKYKTFRDMLQKAVRLNLKMSEAENQQEAKISEIYAEISSFTETIRSLLH